MPFGLRRVLARRFPHPAAQASSPAHTARLTTYLTDLLTPYGLALSTATFEGQSYGEMAVALLDPAYPVDALVLAYDVPDIAPGRATATYLSHVWPGQPMAFAVSDQGRASAFTGLRLLRDYARTGLYERAVLLVVEQSELPYDPEVPVELPAEHAGVAVYLGGSTVELTAVRVFPGVGLDAVADVLTSFSLTTVVLGGPLAALDVKAERIVLADPAQPMTGVWAALAGVDGPVTLVDYDPGLRYLCVASFG